MSAPNWTIGWPIDAAAIAESRATQRVYDRRRIEWLRREAAELRASGCDAAFHDRAAEYESAADRLERVLERETREAQT